MQVALNGQVTTILGDLTIRMHLPKRFFSTFCIKASVGISIFNISPFPGLVTMATLAQIFPPPLQLEPRTAGGRQAQKWLVMASQGSLTPRSPGKACQLKKNLAGTQEIPYQRIACQKFPSFIVATATLTLVNTTRLLRKWGKKLHCSQKADHLSPEKQPLYS